MTIQSGEQAKPIRLIFKTKCQPGRICCLRNVGIDNRRGIPKIATI